MAEDFDKKLSPEAKQVYGKAHLPHKFCPYCGHRNEARAETCASCGKDISWMRIPEPTPRIEAPKEKPRALPKQRKISRRMMIILLLIVLLILIAVVVLVLTMGKRAGGAVMPGAATRNAGLNLEAAAARGTPWMRPTLAAALVARPINTAAFEPRSRPAPAAFRSLRRTHQCASVARVAGAAHRRSACVTVSMGRTTSVFA